MTLKKIKMKNTVYTAKVDNMDVGIRYPKASDAQAMCKYMNELSQEKTYVTWQGEEVTLEYETEYLNKQLEKIKNKETIKLILFVNKEFAGIADITPHKKVNAVILNSMNHILLLQLVNYGDTDWNTPGGGIEEGETPEEALIRELQEELGTDKFEIVEKSKIKNKYDFPDFVVVQQLKKGNKYKGQEQAQFIVSFLGEDEEIKIQEEEIRAYKWVNYEDLEAHLNFPGQWENIKRVIRKSSINL